MYTLCRSQFLPCALIMAALTAGIFMLFYCLRKKPMWVTVCDLLLIVGSWVSGTIAGRHENADGGVNLLDAEFAEEGFREKGK